jgi:hypothetical protein
MVAGQDLEHRKTEVQLRDPAPSAAGRMFCDFVVCWRQKKSVGRLAWRNQDCFKGFLVQGTHVWNEVHGEDWELLETWRILILELIWNIFVHERSWKCCFGHWRGSLIQIFMGFWGMDEVDHVYNYSQLAAMWVVGDFLVHQFSHPPKR